jgi:hypothetical protein
MPGIPASVGRREHQATGFARLCSPACQRHSVSFGSSGASEECVWYGDPEDTTMLQRTVARRAAEVRVLLDQGAFAGARVPLRNGGTLPAEMFAKIALDDLDYQTRLERGSNQVDVPRWQRIAEDIELLHKVALARGDASAEQGRLRA